MRLEVWVAKFVNVGVLDITLVVVGNRVFDRAARKIVNVLPTVTVENGIVAVSVNSVVTVIVRSRE